MAFQHDAAFAAEVKDFFGHYIGTFESDQRQIRADMFRNGELLEAHVSFPTGLSATRVTEQYLGELKAIAAEQGLPEKLRIIYS
jgi:hypothetical protein